MYFLKNLVFKGDFMPTLTIRNIDQSLKESLRISAAEHGCSMEEEVRRILRKAVLSRKSSSGIGTRISRRFAEIGGVDLPEISRSEPRDLPEQGGDERV
jgi:plasmid stability protein